jgi:hypothetical protein
MLTAGHVQEDVDAQETHGAVPGEIQQTADQDIAVEHPASASAQADQAEERGEKVADQAEEQGEEDACVLVMKIMCVALAATISHINMNFQKSGQAVSASDALLKDRRAGLVAAAIISMPVLFKARWQIWGNARDWRPPGMACSLWPTEMPCFLCPAPGLLSWPAEAQGTLWHVDLAPAKGPNLER